MTDGFVEVYAKSTGAKQSVPEHWLSHPVLGRDFSKTPLTKAIETRAAGTVTPGRGEPSDAWTREQLDLHAAGLNVDSTDLPNKAAVLDAITEATEAAAQAALAGDPTDPDTTAASGQTPAAGENKE
ncbi:hypothetical protein [Nocardioides sp. LML1-1-1.1]|uniref:hypothetical protein n=1 Tax=Nocardioides sp. LML1-1-1.1 TaxID=3135248 RepID=UPI0034439B7B